ENPADKVPRMLDVFTACGVQSWALDLKQTYLNEAMSHLEAVAVVKNRKQPLLELAAYLIQRDV
ncbi:MAG TPA: polyprenyl synthetase, partial [Chitinophagaceae bacterium]|nr:polyprenyl synthetase [Chitinophagaceae bacterium]